MNQKQFVRILSVLLAVLLILALSACGEGGDASSNGSSGSSTANTTADPRLTPKLVTPVYETVDTVVAAADVTEFGADPTGKEDSTDAIRDAVFAVSGAGGGTVWMPKGTYRITKGLTIPSLVTLRGDYADPDKYDEYGTVILADVASSDAVNTGLINIAASGGVEGLTVYYPNQDINDVKPYPYTFFLSEGYLRTIKNCTLVNSYRGIYVAYHESTMLKNVKGTILMEGINIHSAADVGTFDGVTFTPDYWANAKGDGIQNVDAKTIAKWSQENESHGMTIHDVEQQQFNNITVKGHAYGIFFSAMPTRFMGSGPWFDVTISDCTYGIYAEKGSWISTRQYAIDKFPTLTSIDWRCGYIFSKVNISGTKYSICNESSTVKDLEGNKQSGFIRLTDATLKGATKGKVIYSTKGKDADLSKYNVDTDRTVKPTGTAFEYVLEGGTQADIQSALDRVGKAGGGVVYVGPGDYQISGSLKVPANTELHGAAGSAQRLANVGTRFWCVGEEHKNRRRAYDADAMVTLAGDHSGVSGVFFLYEENIKRINSKQSYRYYAPAIRGQGSHVWAVDCCISGANYGILFNNCPNYVIENLISCCINGTVEASGDNGLVLNCLNNGNVLFRHKALVYVDEGIGSPYFFSTVGRTTTVYIHVGAGKNQQVVNCFIYGGKKCVEVEDASDLLIVNIGSDHMGECLYEFKNASATVISSVLTAGTRSVIKNSDVRIYNEMSLSPDHDKDVIQNNKK